MNKRRSLNKFDYKRLLLISFFLFLLFSFLIIQFYKIQIIEGERWKRQALLQHRSVVKEPFMRGRFLSSDGSKAFVTDVLKFHLFIDPLSIPKDEKVKIANYIFNFFQLSGDERKKLFKNFYKDSRSRKLVSWVDPDRKELLDVWWRDYIKDKKIAKNAIFFKKDYKRSYPFGPLLGQVLHTVREVRVGDFKVVPTGGLEYYFDDYLSGKLGYKQIVRSPKNALETKKVIQHPENGSDIYLTVDRFIQAIVEEELKKGVLKVSAKSGFAVMINPKTGEILAIAQYPFFDVRKYGNYFSDDRTVEHTRAKAILDSFEPGSIMKPITLAICCMANRECERLGIEPIFSPMEKIATYDGSFKGRSKPIRDLRSHRFLNMYLAVQKSSNIYVARLVDRVIERLGKRWYHEALKSFGFGKKVGVEFPAETPGFLPVPNKNYSNGRPQWAVSTPYSLAMGYNILVSALQMTRAYSIIANHGVDVKPFLVKRVVKGEGELFKKSSPERRRVFKREDAAQIINAMKFTTKVGGTARIADIPGFTEAGKTGTAEKIVDGQYSGDLHISSFVGFAPAHDARFVLMVSIDEPKKKYIPGEGKIWYGGYCAAPIFRKIGERTLEYLGVAPDDPFGYPWGDSRADRKRADWSDEVSLMKKLYQRWNGR